jgi:hypothetical protein
LIASKEELTVDRLRKIFKINKNSLLYSLEEKFAECLIECAGEPMKTIEEYKERFDWEEEDELKEIQEYFDNGMIVYMGEAGTESCDNTMEIVICDMDIHVKTKDLIIEKDGGF